MDSKIVCPETGVFDFLEICWNGTPVTGQRLRKERFPGIIEVCPLMSWDGFRSKALLHRDLKDSKHTVEDRYDYSIRERQSCGAIRESMKGSVNTLCIRIR